MKLVVERGKRKMLTQEMALKALDTGRVLRSGNGFRYRVVQVESKGGRWWRLTIESGSGRVSTFTNRVTDGVSNLYLA